MADDLSTMPVIDIDSHWTEPRDLWTSRAPAKFRDKTLRVVEVKGNSIHLDDNVLDWRKLLW